MKKCTKQPKQLVQTGETIHNMPFKVTPSDVYAAMLTADKIGEEFGR